MFWEKHPQAEAPLRNWYAIVEQANFTTPVDVKAMFNSADIVSDSRVIFDIGGNKYRLVVRISYAFSRVMVKFIGTHTEYDDIDPGTV